MKTVMKIHFMTRSLREKVLVLAFIGFCAVWWLSSSAGRLATTFRERRGVNTELAAQKLWLDDQERIQERANKAVAALDQTKTFGSTRLVAEIAAMAATAGLAVNTDSPRTQSTSQFAFHTVQVNFRKANLAALIAFYRAVGERAPYLALEQFTLQADRSDPSQLNVSAQVASIELVP